MGCIFSKKTAVNPPPPTNTTNSQDLTSYEAACRVDPELRSFDSIVHRRTSQVMNSLAVGVEARSLSLDSLREVTESLLEMDQDVIKVILECKKDIWKNKELFSLVEDYFKNSLEFFLLFQSIYNTRMFMLIKLQAEKGKLDKKLRSMKKWRKLSNVLFVATFTAVLICSVVAAAVAAPPVLTALAAAAAVPSGSMGKWVNSIWKKHENEIKGQQEFISSMEIGTYLVVKDLDQIRVLVDKLEIEIEALLHNADFALREGDAVEIAINEIKKKLSGFMQTIENLSLYADKCSRDVGMARTMILHKMIKYPST